MRNLLLGTVAIVALIAGPANAADLAVKAAPVYKAPPPVVTYYSWTGCYVGGHVGGLWAKKDWTLAPPDPMFALGSHDADSWLGGVQAGCDYQFAGGFVIGIQGDYAWTDANGSNVRRSRRPHNKSLANQIAGDGHRPHRLRLGPFPRLREGRRRVGAR